MIMHRFVTYPLLRFHTDFINSRYNEIIKYDTKSAKEYSLTYMYKFFLLYIYL